MPLFTDGNISDIDDLRAYDSSILRAASSEGVDLAAKLALAETEIGIEIEEFLTRRTGPAFPGGAGGFALSDVVVTSALKQWHTLLALTLTYADIEGNHLNSRYGTKAKEFRRRARWAAESLFRSGVGVIHSPIPKAGQPAVRLTPGAAPVQTYYLQIAWRGPNGASGAPSDVIIFTPEADGYPTVTSPAAPQGVTGYDIFAGTAEDAVARQNEEPLGVDAEWTMPPTGLVEGMAPGDGQAPETFIRNDRVLRRG